eukprot:gnl/TRDRNA2_/TRDRNA2_123774_c0_seq1.p2 gnl/TRDRNA2_/TRDRNA2_123774_c0~~gnl/TRDRNA2_/TRDRNA2_123774_c0_seq1.p2  ORF type:complete len:125 (+),score=2.25 gnl/TRDRNA2_/TRDRNA2_123774_c0_seq1:306-680(+)
MLGFAGLCWEIVAEVVLGMYGGVVLGISLGSCWEFLAEVALAISDRVCGVGAWLVGWFLLQGWCSTGAGDFCWVLCIVRCWRVVGGLAYVTGVTLGAGLSIVEGMNLERTFWSSRWSIGHDCPP